MRKANVAVIAPMPVFEFFKSNHGDKWNFTVQADTPLDFVKKLRERSISSEIEIIFILDAYSGADNMAMERLVVKLGAHALIMIPEYKPEVHDQIDTNIRNIAIQSGLPQPAYYYIPGNSVNIAIDKAVKDYVDTQRNQAAEIIRGEVAKESDMFSDFDIPDTPQPSQQEEPKESPYLGRVIAVTSSKGGSGKTAVAMSLSAYLARNSAEALKLKRADKKLRVCLVDIDIKDGQVGFLIGKNGPTVLNMSGEGGVNLKSLQETVIQDARLGIDVLLPPKRPRFSKEVPVSFYRELLHLLRQEYDYIILDTSVDYTDPLIEDFAYQLSDLIVFVTDFVVNSFGSMCRWFYEVTSDSPGSMKIPKEKVGIVVNKALGDVGVTPEILKKVTEGHNILSVIPNNAKLMSHSANLQSMSTVLKNDTIRSAIARVAESIVGNDYPLLSPMEFKG